MWNEQYGFIFQAEFLSFGIASLAISFDLLVPEAIGEGTYYF